MHHDGIKHIWYCTTNLCLKHLFKLSFSWKGEKSKMSIHDPSQQWCSMRQIHLLELLKLKITQKVSSSVETKVWYPEEVSFQFNYRYCEPKKFLFKECHAASAADAAGASFFFFVVSVDFWNLNLCEICWWCMRGQNISIVSSYFHFFLLDVVQQKYKHFAHGQGSVLLQRIAYWCRTTEWFKHFFAGLWNIHLTCWIKIGTVMHWICITSVPFSANVGLFLEIICEFIAEGFQFFYSYLNLFSDEIFSLQASTKK